MNATARFDVERFEAIYERSPDPWDYERSPYERAKYEDTLAALPARQIGRALEVGCSIGVFSELLAARCEQLVAIDFSERALALAAQRLARLPNVETLRASFPEQAPGSHFDLVVCSEVLYYLDEQTLREATAWLASRLEQGATVLAVSWRGAGAEEPMRGDEAHDVLLRELGRWHAFARLRDAYRIDRFDG